MHSLFITLGGGGGGGGGGGEGGGFLVDHTVSRGGAEGYQASPTECKGWPVEN